MFTIDPNAWYEEYDLRIGKIFSEAELHKARVAGLKCREITRGRRLYKGAWLLAWLEGKPAAESNHAQADEPEEDDNDLSLSAVERLRRRLDEEDEDE